MTSEAEELIPDEPLEPLLETVDDEVRPETRDTSRANLAVYLKEVGRIPILVHTAKVLTAEDRQRLDGKVESIVEKAEFQPERFLELLLKRGERRKRAA